MGVTFTVTIVKCLSIEIHKKQAMLNKTSLFYLYLKLVPKKLFGITGQAETFCK